MAARWLPLCACGLLAACGPATGSPVRPVSGGSAAPSASAGCVDKTTATVIWTSINSRLDAIVLDPNHAGLADVTTGTAMSDLQQYIQTTLASKNLTEREVDRLDNLTVTDAACTGGNLVLTVDTTVTKDDYLKPDGSVDHSDPSVGSQLHLLETYTRVNGTWKEADIADASGPSPSGSIV